MIVVYPIVFRTAAELARYLNDLEKRIEKDKNSFKPGYIIREILNVNIDYFINDTNAAVARATIIARETEVEYTSTLTITEREICISEVQKSNIPIDFKNRIIELLKYR